MNEQTISAFSTFESLLCNAINELDKSLQETHSLNAMYLEQFNDILKFKSKTKAFTHFLHQENEYHKQKYAEFKSKINIPQPTVIDHKSNVNSNKSINKLNASIHSNLDQIKAHQIANEINENDINTGEIESDSDDDDDIGLLSNNISFGGPSIQPIEFRKYSPPIVNENIEDHPHYHPLIHDNNEIEGTQLMEEETAINGEINQPIFDNNISDINQCMNIILNENNRTANSHLYAPEILTICLLFKLMKLNDRVVGNMNNLNDSVNNNHRHNSDEMVVDVLNNRNLLNDRGKNNEMRMKMFKIFMDCIGDVIMKSDKYSIVCNELRKLLTFDKFLTC